MPLYTSAELQYRHVSYCATFSKWVLPDGTTKFHKICRYFGLTKLNLQHIKSWPNQITRFVDIHHACMCHIVYFYFIAEVGCARAGHLSIQSSLLNFSLFFLIKGGVCLAFTFASCPFWHSYLFLILAFGTLVYWLKLFLFWKKYHIIFTRPFFHSTKYIVGCISDNDFFAILIHFLFMGPWTCI